MRLYFRHVVSNLCWFSLAKKNQIKWCNSFLTSGQSRNRLILALKQSAATISSTPRRSRYEISWSTQVQTHYEITGTVPKTPTISDGRPVALASTRSPSSAAQDFAISRSDKSLRRRFSMNWQRRALFFHLAWNLARSIYIFLLGNFQSSSLTPRQMSTQHPYLTVNENAKTEEFLTLKMTDSCDIDGLRVLVDRCSYDAST